MAQRGLTAIVWCEEEQAYELQTAGKTRLYRSETEDADWFSNLAACSGFRFVGRHGHMTVRKESRKRGSGYWYGYRRRNGRTHKQYIGRDALLTLEYLEHIAQKLAEEAEAEPADPPLLAVKLRMPRLAASLIRRERLLELFDTLGERQMLLVTAPAGSGKTTVVCQWLQRQALPVAWVALDEADNDLSRFWRYVITACQTLHRDATCTARELLASLLQQPENALTLLLNALAESDQPGILVLEDYHLITMPRIHETLAFFLEHLPPSLHVLLTSRSEPPLPLARFRARGELGEVQASDLRFSLEEERLFLRQFLERLPDEKTLHRLDARLEGWAAGLRLLALALQGRQSLRELDRFAGSTRPLREYFVTEALNAQPEPLQRFLLLTGGLPRVAGSLCDAVLGLADEGTYLLERLYQSGLFLEPLDSEGRWYRYHPLFAEAMQAEARRRLGDEAVQATLEQASFWFEREGLLVDAVECSLQVRDMERAAALILRMVSESQFRVGLRYFHLVNEHYTLLRWLKQLPKPLLWRYPLLCLRYAEAQLFAALLNNRPPQEMKELEEPLQRAEQGFRSEGNLSRLGEVFAFRATLARQRGEMREAVTWAHQALIWLLPEEQGWRSSCLGIIGIGALYEGHLLDASRYFAEALANAEKSGNKGLARAQFALQGAVLAARGRLRQAAAHYQRALLEASKQGDQDDVMRLRLNLAAIHYEWNEVENAREAVQEIQTYAGRIGDEELFMHAELLLARLEQAGNQSEHAIQRLQALLERLQALDLPLRLSLLSEVRLALVRLYWLNGNLEAVRQWANERQRDRHAHRRLLHEREECMVARLALAEGRCADAHAILAPLLDAALQDDRQGDVLEIRLLLAQATKQQTSRSLLHAALHQARAEGGVQFLRRFLDEGPALLSLLQQHAPHFHERPLQLVIQKIVRAAGSAQPAEPVEPLSARELHVLRLLASGLSYRDIARALFVSVNTIKTQVSSIYRKLGVNTRQQACSVARALQLLPQQK
uniref:Helix-turn-helix transcriptional regulator n=1 Tax=Thermosporothrix sp. COM3 TaxID=2490863 RepID=A0A455SCK8_9CHLR|nr:helix-turn-helix transcriptional regulator [Thermosporothrix sp. COM3]